MQNTPKTCLDIYPSSFVDTGSQYECLSNEPVSQSISNESNHHASLCQLHAFPHNTQHRQVFGYYRLKIDLIFLICLRNEHHNTYMRENSERSRFPPFTAQQTYIYPYNTQLGGGTHDHHLLVGSSSSVLSRSHATASQSRFSFHPIRVGFVRLEIDLFSSLYLNCGKFFRSSSEIAIFPERLELGSDVCC